MTAIHLRSDILEIARALGPLARELSGKTILLCGGGGFLGRYFTDLFAHLNASLLEKPAKVLVLDSLITAPGSAAPRLPRNFRFLRHDIAKPFRSRQRLHFILQAAGIASPYYYRAYPLETLEAATLGTKNMLLLAREHGARILYFSSSEIYGDPDPKHVPTPESYRGNVSCHGPRACYDESKRLGETLCTIFHEKFGTPAVIVRPFNVYGPGMAETDYRVLPNFAGRIKARRPLKIYGTGRQTRTFCYVSDAVAGFLRALLLGVPGEAYNIGNPRPEISMLGLVRRVEAALGRTVPYDLVEYPDSYPADEPARRCPDITKAGLQLRYQPRVNLEEGLKRFLSWALESYTGQPGR